MSITKSFFSRPIRAKISAAILIVLLGVSAFNLLFFPAQQKKLAVEGIKAKGETIALMLAHNLSSAGGFEDHQFIQRMIEVAFQDEDLSFVRVLRVPHNDTLLFQSSRQGHAKPEAAFASLGWEGGVFTDGDRLYLVKPIKVEFRTLGALTLALSLDRLKAEMARTRRLILGLDLFLLLLGIAIARFLSGLLTKPIRKITRAADRLTEGEWGIQVPLEHSDEIGVLGGIFNRMSQIL